MANTFKLERLSQKDLPFVMETEKAVAIDYHVPSGVRWTEKLLWLPKSQITYTTHLDYENEDPEGVLYEIMVIEMPMWLARKHNYFKNMVF